MNLSEARKSFGFGSKQVNVGDMERLATIIGGATLLLDGLRRGLKPSGVAETFFATLLVQRGASGHSYLYEALNVNTAQKSAADLHNKQTVLVRQKYTINRSAHELYSFWRQLDNLPQFMRHVESIEVLDSRHSRWKVKGPGGLHLEWNAEITENVPNALIAWKSTAGDIANSGYVRFRPAPGERGTELEVTIQYAPPAGVLGAKIARLFGEDPERQVREDLRRFKQLMETGEIATIEGQPSGSAKGRQL
jgi:uncharacterized membrane protein